jgi:hypothetical protein
VHRKEEEGVFCEVEEAEFSKSQSCMGVMHVNVKQNMQMLGKIHLV